MRRFLWLPVIIAIGLFACPRETRAVGQSEDDGSWTSEFGVEEEELSATGRNPYFILEPGYQLVFESKRERLVITVLDETKTVAGVETRVVEERETKDGKLVEISRNFFAISKRTNSVFYFGEEVEILKDGKVVGREGEWLAGEKGATFGLIMPGLVLLRARHYQEIAPKVAMDRAEIVSMSATVKTPAGEFKNCLKVEETTPLEPGEKEYKYYARGIGLLQDGSLKLVRYGKAEKRES
ncbi:MAG: hypothetical protein Q8Q12_07475 [bacterium]|nr:hypothetical protein [bacterium]